MDIIRIDVGVYTTFYINLEKVDFTNVKEVILTIKNSASVGSKVIIERVFTEQAKHEVTITPEESIRLNNNAVYDLNKVTKEGIQKKITENGTVTLRNGVGSCLD